MFHTKLPYQKASFSISHTTKILLIGSCFTENIGKTLSKHQFQSYSNPFGIIYNPVSIFRNLINVINQKKYSEEDLFYYNEQWHCFDHHSSFSNSDLKTCLNGINSEIKEANQKLKNADYCFISLGTAWIHTHNQSSKIVGNCHKVPNKDFTKSLLSVSQIVDEAKGAIEKIRELNPKIQFIFTVSPIRHLKDGFHENQLSKSAILLAINQLQNEIPAVSYFPSYEIMMDDLRDYRFYAEDMVHPSQQAIKYIWEYFSNYYFDSKTQLLNTKITNINSSLEHRAFNPTSEQTKKFKENLDKTIAELEKEYPYLKFKF